MIKIDHISFSYGEENENTGGVRDIDLNIEDGQFVVLCGESGCGKTTITRLINGLIPHYYEGQMAGEVWVNGEKVSEQPLYDTAAVVGSVFQNPRSQFFNVDTTSEITFGCENLGQPEKDIRERFAKTVRDFRLEKLMDRNIFHLSGGEKQKIACAGVSIMEPDVLVMDEPSSNLDAASILDLRKILAFWKSQGKTIIVSEHRLYYLRGLADRFIYLAEGQVSRDYSAAEFEQLTEQQRSNMGLRTFALERLLPPVLPQQEKTALALHNFRFAYKNEPETLHIMDCEIPTNRIVGIIGNNGAGKSTFSRCFCGLEKRCGEIVWNGRKYRPKDRLSTCYMVMQEVNHQLFTESVLDEVLISMEEENQERAEEILNRLDLLAFKDRHPMSLSGGQKQRVAIASAIASKRSILFFDEPTSGLDYRHMKEVANVLRQVRDAGITVYVITHDLELILDCCTDIIHLEDGSIPSHANWAGGNQTYLCATQAPYYVKRNFLELAAHDIKLDCAYLDVFTCNEPDECFEPHHKMTRKECLEFRSRCFAYLLSQNILSSSEEVADWSVANLVFCHYAPYDFMMRRPEEPKQGIPVPLFNLVYHDCVIIPWMMEKHENEDYMLYALINGGAPYFDRNGAYDGTDGAFGAGSDFTEEEQKKRCEQVASLHEHVAYSELVSHRILDKTGLCQQSTFADGTCVEVDFSKGTYKITVNG